MRPRLFMLLLAAPLVALAEPTAAIEWVHIGDPGNAPDTATNCYAPDCGSVPYEYYIAKYEVTTAQYVEFLNTKAASDPFELYLPGRPVLDDNGNVATWITTITRTGSPGSYIYAANPGFATKPVMQHVSFYSALRFTNWLGNGKGSGDTETGAYTLLGGTAIPTNGLTVTRNPGAIVFLPSENEWYKAAYFSVGVSASYFDYPTGTNTPPVCSGPTATVNHANCAGPGIPRPGVGQPQNVEFASTVGSYTGSPSPSGTFDQAGNVWEYNEDIVDTGFGLGRGLRGGAYHQNVDQTAASFRNWVRPNQTIFTGSAGFRLASLVPPPELCSNTLDDDGDGYIDYPADPGCTSASDTNERRVNGPDCDDNHDDDGDGLLDYPDDPGCTDPFDASEINPACIDGLDNDGDGSIDFDGGATVNGGVPLSDPDPQCVGKPNRNSEKPNCGLGGELVFVLAPVLWLRRRRTARAC